MNKNTNNFNVSLRQGFIAVNVNKRQNELCYK